MKPDRGKFDDALSVLNADHRRFNIGTYMERSQHLVLKYYFEPDPECHEVPYLGHIADIKNGNGITEIQTSGFGALRAKLEVFLRSDRVTVVTPVTVRRRVVWTDPETGDTFLGKYRLYAGFKYRFLAELLYISEQFGNDNLTVVLCGVNTDEYRILDGYGADRKKRATKADTVPASVEYLTELRCASDVLETLPFKTGEELTNKQLAASLHLSGRRLWNAVKFLSVCGILRQNGKKGNSFIYTVTDGGKAEN